jgi:uncharacterized delta-60 repeat protein
MKNQFLFIIIVVVFSINATAQLAGTLNSQFSQDGWDDAVFGNNNGITINKTLIQPDGKILVCAGAQYPGEGLQAVITRYFPDGTIDNNFGGGDGVVRSKEDTSMDFYTSAVGMALQSNGKIIIAGDVFSNIERIFCLNADGSLDTTFGTNGVVEIASQNLEFITHVAVQSDNKIIVCGKERRLINNVIVQHVFLWRFTQNGILDTTFGASGVVSYNNSTWLASTEILLNINDLIILPDDKIVINQTYTATTNSYVMLRKFNANGSSDSTFGSNGEAIKSEIFTGGDRKYSSSSLQQNGSIVTSFTSRSAANSNYTESLFRVNAQGILDASFNINLENPTTFPEILKVIASGEKIYVFKNATEDFSSFDEINCYDLDGNSITSFGTNGIALINQNNIPTSYPAKAVVSNIGSIYIASTISNPSLGEMFFVSNVIGFDPNLSTTDNLIENKIIVFPNPTKGIVSISNPENVVIKKVELVDGMGKIIAVATENTAEIDLTTYSSGIYVLKIYSGECIFQKKIIR